MGKLTYEVPAELKDFAATFDAISYRHSDYGTVFGDFLGYITGGFLVDGDPLLAAELQRKYGDDYGKFNELVVHLIKAYGVMVKDDNSWYDGLGIFYEIIASRYKSSALGQFFTPPCVVDLMSKLINPIERETVNDPCCGSGRLILAAKVVNPKLWAYAADVDPICAKMTAVNMAIHGCNGEVACMNTLTMDWRFGYVVNPYLGLPGINPFPHLRPVHCWEESRFYVKAPELKAAAELKLETGQLALF